MTLPTILVLTVVAAWFWYDHVGRQISDCEALKKRMPVRQWDMDTKIYRLSNLRARLLTYMTFAGAVSMALWLRGLWD